jgi:hypothetical protein
MRARSVTIEADTFEEYLQKSQEEMMARASFANPISKIRSKRIHKFTPGCFLGMRIRRLPEVPEFKPREEYEEYNRLPEITM